MDPAGGRIGEKVGEALGQDAAGTPAGFLGVVLTSAFAAGEVRIDTGAGRTHDQSVG
jgi:hypothetical protein